MRLLPFVALVALAAVSGHICSINPRQRGTFDISEPGSSACIRYKPPCGGEPSATPVVTITAGQRFHWDFQQNLNHYSIGSGGRFEFGQSLLADPQTDADFVPIGTVQDYPAYHQFTQTNISALVMSRHEATDHGVLRIKYISNKPTEPTFIQCIDIKALAAEGPMEPPSVRLVAVNGQPVPTVAAAPTAPAAIAGERSNGTIVGIGPGIPARVVSISPATGKLATLGYLPYPIALADSRSGNHYASALSTVNRKTQELFLLFSEDFDPPTQLHVYDVSKTTPGDYKPKYTASVTPVGYPASAIHYDSANDAVIVVGFQPDNSSWCLRVTSLNYRTSTASLLVVSAALEPFVDFVWSEFDAATRKLFVLVRHEDEPTSLPAKLLTFDLKTSDIAILDVPSTYTFSTFFVQPDSAAGAITFFTPGAVDADTGLIVQPNWQVVTMDTKSGGFQVLATFPAKVNSLPIYWGGGVASFDGASGDFAYLFVPTSPDFYPSPDRMQTLAYDTKKATSHYYEIEMPYAFNTAIFGGYA